MLIVYVDDIILTSDGVVEMEKLKKSCIKIRNQRFGSTEIISWNGSGSFKEIVCLSMKIYS